MESSEMTFNLKLTQQPKLSNLGQAVVRLSELAEALANEDRTLVNHRSGRPENVAEHSNMLAIIAPAIAEEFFPDLNPNLVARYASIHDCVEAYVGDTPTHDISEQGLIKKAQLEELGLVRLKHDFRDLPKFITLTEEYEAQLIPESRFVRVLDKCMPALLHLANDGKVLASYITKAELLGNSEQRALSLRLNYPEFERLVALREELSKFIADAYLG